MADPIKELKYVSFAQVRERHVAPYRQHMLGHGFADFISGPVTGLIFGQPKLHSGGHGVSTLPLDSILSRAALLSGIKAGRHLSQLGTSELARIG